MAEEKKQLFSYPRLSFYLFSLIVFYLAFHYIGTLKDIRILVQEMKPVWLLVVIVAQMITYLFNSLILKSLLGNKNGTIQFGVLYKISIVIMFVNQALPSGGLSGNGYIFKQLVKRGITPGRAFAVLVFESLCYYLAFLLVLGGAYLYYLLAPIPSIPVISYAVLAGFLFFMLLGLLVILMSNRHTMSWIVRKLRRCVIFRRYLMKHHMRAIPDSNATMSGYFVSNKRGVFQAVLMQIGILLCDMITISAIIRAFHVHLPLGSTLLGMLLAQVIGSLPISPGGLIAYESSLTYFYHALGVQINAALIITLLYRFFTFWLPIPVGLLLYRNLQR